MKSEIDSIQSKRLVLENRKESHANELYEQLCEKDLYNYINPDIPQSKEWLASRFKKLESQSSPDGSEIWLAYIGRDKITQLSIGVFEITINNGEAFIAYTVFKKYWGKGYAKEATQAVIKFISIHYKIDRFVIEMDTRNRNSIKIAEKLGFDFVKVTNNVAFIKNFVSHEFQFQKII